MSLFIFIRTAVSNQSSSTSAITMGERRQYKITGTSEPNTPTTNSIINSIQAIKNTKNDENKSSKNQITNFFHYFSPMLTSNKTKYNYDPVVTNPLSTTTNVKNPSSLSKNVLQKPIENQETKEELKMIVKNNDQENEDFVTQWLTPKRRIGNTMIYQEDGGNEDVESNGGSSGGSIKRRVSV